jgi:hypothetical protein
MSGLANYLFYFGLTLVVELPLLAFALQKRCGIGRALLAGLLGSGLTHPLLWFVWRLVIPPIDWDQWVRYAVSGETLVVVIEAAILYAVALRGTIDERHTRTWVIVDSFLVSLAVNAVSFGVGALTW